MGQVLINEILYHPEELDVAFPNYDDREDAEFVEVWNSGNSSVDISLWSFDGISYCFPNGTSLSPNQYLVLAKSSSRVQSIFGITAFAEYDGKLSNSGETLELFDELGTSIHKVKYKDNHLWPVKADGLGYSLELQCPSGDITSFQNWDISSNPGGHTGGSQNSIVRNTEVPKIDSTYVLSSPQAGSAIPIYAAIDGSNSSTLEYTINFGAIQTVSGNVQNGQVQFTIPALVANDILHYKINAQNAEGTFSLPRNSDLVDSYAIVVPDPTRTSNFPIINRYFNSPTPDTTYVTLEHEGISTSSAYSWYRRNKHWKIELNKGQSFEVPGHSSFIVDEFQFNRPDHIFSWWVHGTMARTAVYTEIIGDEGEPALDAFNVRVDENGIPGQIWTYLSWPDGDWRDRVGVATDGSEYYKFPSTSVNDGRIEPEIKHPKNGDTTAVWALNALKDSIGPHLMDIYDIPGMVNFAALSTLICHWDAGVKNFYMHKGANGRWDGDIWDVDASPRTGIAEFDSTWCRCNALPVQDTIAAPWNANYLPSPTNLGNTFARPLLENVPRVQEMYERRMRTLIDKYYAPGELINRVMAVANPTDPDILYTAGVYSPAGHDFIQNQQDVFVNMPVWQMARYDALANFPSSASGTTDIVINEIQYAPIGGDGEEFVELYNNGSESVELSNWTLEGVNLTFPFGTVILAGDYLVVASWSPDFISKYGSGKYVAADFRGSRLQNGSEIVRLVKPDGTVEDELTYGLAGWKGAHGGPSLERINPNAASNDPNNWAPSSSPFGSPDEINSPDQMANYPGPNNLPNILINEIMYDAIDFGAISGANAEFVEIKNAGNSTIDLSGYSFSKGLDYTFPTGSILAPGAIIVLAKDAHSYLINYGVAAYDTYDGKLSDTGEELEILNPLGYVVDELTYSDLMPWPLGANGTGYSIGLLDATLDNSLGGSWDLQLVTSTPGVENLFCVPATVNSNITQPLCPGINNGQASLSASAGNGGPFTYSWSHGPLGASISNLAPGNYVCTISDQYGCPTTETITINSVTNILQANSIDTNPSLFGVADGSINLSTSAVNAVSYAWSNGASTEDISGLSPGTYTVNISDANGCTTIYSTTISPGPQLPVAAASFTPNNGVAPINVSFNAAASNDPDGSIVSYAWNFGDGSTGTGINPSHNFSNPGTYTITLVITDSQGLTDTVTLTVNVIDTCDPPTNITLISASSNTLIVNWQGDIDAQSYNLRYRDASVGGGWTNFPTTGTTAIITGLNDCSDYEVKVSNQCSFNLQSGYSATQIFSTTNCFQCTAPLGLYQFNIQNISAIITWDVLVGVSSYTYKFRKVGDVNWISQTTTFPIAVLFGISGCTDYEWTMETTCYDGSTAQSGTINNFTTQCKNDLNSANEIISSKLLVYPNPAKDKITIITPHSETNELLQIIDSQGRQISSVGLDSASESIEQDVSDLSPGVYLIIWKDEKQTFIKN